ncbi:MAG: hypothetical protein M1826_006533 [Phylliscum demangeonii]|nr:MAG: hypothetical protein M1826_006533 [Phylliscum demangeonii]
MPTPTLINLPPASNPDTPSEMGPGTPNSGTTSLSTLSTTAIKDGHRGHAAAHVIPPGHSQSANPSGTTTLEAERADRISRLAGLERMSTGRVSSGVSGAGAGLPIAHSAGYFDAANPQIRERSTVGSASATGSLGGGMTWASSSDVNDADKMSEERDDVSITDAVSDNASYAGAGEGASSTISGPISSISRAGARPGGVGNSPSIAKALATSTMPTRLPGTAALGGSSAAEPRREPAFADGMTDEMTEPAARADVPRGGHAGGG